MSATVLLNLTSGNVTWQIALTGIVVVAIQSVIVGFVLSNTVNVVVHWAILPVTSVTVIVKVVVPKVRTVFFNGDCVIVTPPQVSEATVLATQSGAEYWQVPLANTVWGAGQVVIIGGVTSTKVYVVLQEILLLWISVDVKVTIVVPNGITEETAGLCERTILPQLSGKII